MTVAEQRQLVFDQIKVIAECGLYRFQDVVDDPLKWMTFHEVRNVLFFMFFILD